MSASAEGIRTQSSTQSTTTGARHVALDEQDPRTALCRQHVTTILFERPTEEHDVHGAGRVRRPCCSTVSWR